ncbi:hypothetical protein OS493_025189 [Desmophyllum pertusum]|uniref:EF-hand domain-containing protein n=1 Tax=Desmophyllum pertusum TaxID=174260 RepID=A0A9X0A0B2_9CNID|nr:hypothetical protein OS493_025189 [Desmophyllum pertusum]
MADKLTQDQIEEYRDAFQHFDKDNSGFITTKELGNAMRSLGENPREEDLQMMINSVDIDGNGQMDFEEFVKLMVAKNQFSFNEREAKEAFRIFDRDCRGYVMSEELRQVFQTLEEKIPEHDINEMLQDQKHQFNRKISFDVESNPMKLQNVTCIFQESIPECQLEEYFEAFRCFDKDNSGYITTKELGTLMKSLGENPTENELQRIINTVDIDRNGMMDFQEFVKLMSTKNQFGMEVNEAKGAFRIFDSDDRGYVLTSELRQAFGRLEENISESELDDILEDKCQAETGKYLLKSLRR